MRPQFGTGRWLDYLGDDPAEDAIHAAYGPNYDRLTKVERHYDPDNLFHLNHHVAPQPDAQEAGSMPGRGVLSRQRMQTAPRRRPHVLQTDR